MNTLKHQWVGIILGLLALFLALNGPALAADPARAARALITGKQIKDGSIQAKDLSKKARITLRGRTGPRGPAGAQGVQGPPGPIEGVTAGGHLTGTYPNPQIAPGIVGVPELDAIPAVRIVGSATSVPNDVITTVNWGTGQTYETEGTMFDPAEGTKLVAPVTGIYLAHASIGFNGDADGVRTVAIAINGSNSNPACFDRRISASPTLATFVNASCPVLLTAGQFVTATVTQTSGDPLGFNGFESMSLTWISSLS